MPSSHLIHCRPLLLLSPIPPSIRVFSNESTLCMRWPKYWSFSSSIIPSKEIPGLISFRMDWLDLLAVQGTLKSLLQHYSSKASCIYMEFGKMVMMTLYVRQQKRHRCIEQSFGLCGRGRGWDDLGEWHCLWKWHLSCTFLYLWASVSLCWLWYTGPVLGSGGMSQYPTQPMCCGFSVSPEADQPTPEKEATDYGGGLQSPTISSLCDPGQVGWPLSVLQLSRL